MGGDWEGINKFFFRERRKKKYKYFILENAFQTFKILNIFKLNAMKNIDMFQTKRAVLLNRNCKLGFCTKYLYCSAVSCDVLVVF